MSGTIGLTLTTNPTVFTGSERITGTAVYGMPLHDWNFTNHGTLIGASAPAQNIYGYGVFLASPGTVVNAAGGLIEGGNIGVVIEYPGTVMNAGTILETGYNNTIGYGFGVELDAGGVITNSTGGFIAGYYGVSLRGGTLVNAGTIENLGAASAVNFAPATTASLLELQSGSRLMGEITGFVSGDTIALSGQSITSETFSGGVLSLYGANGLLAALALGESSGVGSGDFSFSTDATGDSIITTDVPCFTAGTRLRVPGGEIQVEALRIGDLVTTQSGAVRPIKWIGTRAYDGRFITGQHLVLPIHIQAHAIAPGVPSRELSISPGHAIWLGGALIPAWRLLNGITITQPARAARVEYFHIELEAHDILLAENCPAESFLDTGCRGQFQNHRQLAQTGAQQRPIHGLPRTENGGGLAAIQRRLAARAGITRPAARPSVRLLGFIDQAGPRTISGWAQNPAAPEAPVWLEITQNGRRLARLLANTHRADLRAAGIGDGCHGFEITLPEPATGGIEVRHAATGWPLQATRPMQAA